MLAGSTDALGEAASAGAADPSGTPLLHETFTGTHAPDFTGYNEACLTGAPAGAPPPGAHAVGGCEPTEIGPVPPLDAAPHGYLRLTDAGHDRSAAVLFNHPLPANEGLDVSFDAWQYGSTTPANPADGISFFLTNGEANLTHPGAFGGSLGHAKKQAGAVPTNPFIDGVRDGYLGVGLDVLGNYFADTEQRGYSCEHRPSPAGPPTLDADYYERGPNMVTVRGPGNGIEGYCYITATTDFPHSRPPSLPWPSNIPGNLHGSLTQFTPPVTPESAQRELEPSRRRVHVQLTPGPQPRLIVSVDFADGAGPHRVLDIAAPTPVPPTYKFGFAASTGHFTDVHLIRNLAVATDRPLPRLNLVKQVAEPRPGHLSAGDHVRYEYVVTNSGDVPITSLHVSDPVVGPVTCPPGTLGIDETVTCHATYTVTAADVARGHIHDTAVATGEADGREVTSPPSSERLEVTEPPGLIVEKLVQTPGPYHAGQTVRYSYLVTNTGGVPLDNILVSDDHVSGITCRATTLAPAGSPGDHTRCRGSYVITRADSVNGFVTDTAVATGTADGRTVTSPRAQASLLIGPPRLTVRKRALTPGPHFRGDIVRYEYVVTNTGPHTLRAVAIMDSHVRHIGCARTTLSPGQSTLCRGTYRIGAVDAAVGHVTNFAQADGIDSHGHIFLSHFVTARILVARITEVTG